MSWYPLGRPVGTTIYPGMQFIAVWLKRYLFDAWLDPNETFWSLNNVCCYIPAWFGVAATLITGWIAYECSLPENTYSSLPLMLVDFVEGHKSAPDPAALRAAGTWWGGLASPAAECGICAMAMMAIVPAHLMRSVGGGYDNESVSITAMVLTFALWIRSLRTTDKYSYGWAVLAAFSYFYMVASWGGYVFVINMIGVHALTLVLLGRFDTKVYLAYSLFYVLGTALAIQVPVVGWTPLKSLEQLGPCGVFLGYQVLQACQVMIARQQLNRREAWMLRVRVFGAAAVAGIVVVLFLAPTGYFGPLSARVRGLFVQHTKTGNPLVDSVAEHQPASSRAYFQYLHHVCTLAPIGYLMTLMTQLSDANVFLIAWGTAAYFFSHKMVRLILFTAPIGSILGGMAAGRLFCWCIKQWWHAPAVGVATAPSLESTTGTSAGAAGKDKGKSKKGKKAAASTSGSSFDDLNALQEVITTALSTKEGILFKRAVAALVLLMGYMVGTIFVQYSFRLAIDMSNPSIILKARDKDNRIIMVDDYREAYWWLRDNTPEDSRVMAWWDYGYQIAGIANRTTLADGNTWNHEHIALLGKTLTSDLDEAWEIARHWADYVLVWAGGRGDDMAKSPHLARIANSVYRDHCGIDDPTCRAFGFMDREGTPSPMMARSLLYRLHSHNLRPGVEVPPDKFQEVLRTKYGFVRIYKIMGVSEESKAWVADPANKICDAPGSWFCRGQYPPAMHDVLSRKSDFRQLEDFNRGQADEEYQRKYMEALLNPHGGPKQGMQNEKSQPQQQTPPAPVKSVDEIYNTWEDTEDTTLMWKLINSNAVDELSQWLEEQPHKAFIRSRDGRGPMWWAFEQRNEAITNLLMKKGVPHTDKDAKGMTPVDLLEGAK